MFVVYHRGNTLMHYRIVDWHEVVHYADKVWVPDVRGFMFASWCSMGREKTRPRLEHMFLASAKPRNQAVTCLFCLDLRAGARSG